MLHIDPSGETVEAAYVLGAHTPYTSHCLRVRIDAPSI
uniref:RNA-directed DNA polymerase n=1 Tax=Ascaris lumbricoides TaxID=6252 RepID=A0A0M3HNQ3_ASCLU